MTRKEVIGNATLYLGDSHEVLPTITGVDSVVTDPPYGLSFMGKKWDYQVPSVDLWALVREALKPGAHFLSFAGTRTQHRMTVNIEDAGFEIRDMIAWVYGSGFPKSLDVSKAIDKAAGAERVDLGVSPNWRESKRDREKYGSMEVRGEGAGRLTIPTTEAAKQWQGFGTALKPALEPITLARKPINGTVAANVLEHGTGALNIDGCRVSGGKRSPGFTKSLGMVEGSGSLSGIKTPRSNVDENQGRWPANLIHDGSDEVVGLFPESGGQQGNLVGHNKIRQSPNGCFGKMSPAVDHFARNDSGSAARFFYCAKASKRDRNEGCENLEHRSAGEVTDRKDGSDGLNSPRAGAGRTSGSQNFHPTVKPTDLLRYLCRLVTPPNGIVLDPFMGSGSCGKAAILEGFGYVGIEIDPEYFDIACERIDQAQRQQRLFA